MTAGEAACVRCGVRAPVAQLDPVGLGYRCTACTQAGDLETDHMTAGERSALDDGAPEVGFEPDVGLPLTGGIVLVASAVTVGIVSSGALAVGLGIAGILLLVYARRRATSPSP